MALLFGKPQFCGCGLFYFELGLSMRRIIYACLLFAFAFGPAGVAHAQVILYTEGFETNGEGTRYTSNTFTTGASCDFWERSAASPLNTCFNLPNLFTNFQGSFFWGSEDVRIGGVNPNGQLTSSPITITNYNSLTVSLFFAATNGGFLRWEITDEVNIQASFDGGPFTTVGRFIGKDPGSGGDLVIDANLNGVGDPGETVVVSSPAFTKYTFSIPGTGNSLRVRVETNQSGGSEEMGWDVLEVRGVFAPPVCLPPSITCPSTQNLALNSSCEATVPDYTSLGTPVGGTCGPMTVVQASPTIGSTVSGAGTFSVTLYAQNTALQGSTNTCSFTVNKTTPEINVQGNGNTILDGDGSASLTDHTDFGAILVCSGTIVRTFTIQNAPGTRALNITSVTFSGGNSGDFLVSAAPASSVAISGSTTFQVTFNPSGAGVRSTTLNIVTDDCDETTYNFAISGFGNADASAPTITCPSSQNLVLNPCAANLPDYTSLATGLTDNCPGMPTVTQSPAIGSSQSGVGAMTVTLTATDGSSNFTTCTFTVNKVAPEMGVTGNSVAIASGDLVPGLADHTDFGSVIVGNNIVRTFTITNSGPSNLTLGAGSITTVGADFAQFVVGGISLPVSIPQGLSATFTVTFTPGSLGLKTTTVNIANNDCDENPYTFAIQGTGTAAGPEMNVTGNGQSIADGDMLPTTTDHSDFGSVLVCSGTIVRTFTIENVSGTNLTVGAVTLGGAHPGDFVVSASPGSPITSGSNTTFQVTFNPSATGLRTATISIVNNDADENPYDFAIQGTGNADIVNPTITCPANVSVNAGAGVCQATVTFTAPVGADNCAGPVTAQTAGLASGASFPVGVTTNTFRVTDGSGNTATCSFTVTVTDAQLPTITCPANISLNTDPGICTASATYTAPVGADNCPGQTTVRTGGLASGSIYPRGVTTNTFRVTDASGNTATCSFTVTVTDNQLPSITCPSNVSTNNDPGLCSKVVTYTAPIGTDNCTGQSTTQIAGLASGAAYPIGVTTNTFRVTDGSGNTATCSFTVTVTDNQLPVITCPANMSSITNNLDCISATVVYTTPAGTDNCPGQSTTQLVGLASGSSFPTGVTTNTFRVTDAAGNTATCSFTVTVTALVNQTVTIADDTLCPNTGTTVSTASSQTGWSYTLRNDLNSALVAGPLAGTGSALNFNTGPVATTTTYNVTAESPSALLFDGVDDVVNFGNDLNLNLGEYTVEAWVYRTTGNITVSRKFHQHDFGILNNGSMFFNWGNGGSCVWQSGGIFTAAGVVPANQWVHVAWRQMNGSGLDFLVNGTVVFNAGGFHNFTTLNCGQDRYTTTSAPGNKIDDLRIWGVPRSAIQITGNMTACLTGSEPGLLRYYKFTDGGGSSLLRDHSPAAVNGVLQNMDVNNAWIGGVTCVGCSQEMTPTVTATIRDLFPTVATTTPNQSVNTTIGTCGAVVTYTAPTFNDDCDGNGLAGTRIAGLASGATFPVGVTTVTYRYTDASAQSVTSSFTVTVTDNQAPTISCPPNVTTASSPGVCVATAFTYLTPSINDNCPSATLLQVAGLSSGSNFPLGVTTNTFQVTDASGNTATCSFTVTVNDLQNPTITCPANISVSASVGVCNAVVSYTAPVGADNCPSQSTAQTAGLASGASFPTGVTTNTFRVTDGSGNSATCSFTVTVSDNQLPTITCPANISVTVTPGLCNATVSYSAPVGADNCPGQTTTQTAGLASGASFPTGVTTNTFRVTDASANSATCSFTVTVTDNQLPTITCPSNVSGNNDPGLCGKVVTFTAPVGADNCSGQSTTQIAGLGSGSTFPIGVTTNTFRVTDASGQYCNLFLYGDDHRQSGSHHHMPCEYQRSQFGWPLHGNGNLYCTRGFRQLPKPNNDADSWTRKRRSIPRRCHDQRLPHHGCFWKFYDLLIYCNGK
jgi:hypothetical protein